MSRFSLPADETDLPEPMPMVTPHFISLCLSISPFWYTIRAGYSVQKVLEGKSLQAFVQRDRAAQDRLQQQQVQHDDDRKHSLVTYPMQHNYICRTNDRHLTLGSTSKRTVPTILGLALCLVVHLRALDYTSTPLAAPVERMQIGARLCVDSQA